MTSLYTTANGPALPGLRHPQRCLGLIALAACALLTLGACAPLDQAPATQYERGQLLTKVDAVLAASAPGGDLRLVASPDPVVTGQTLRLVVGVRQAGYLYLYQVATDGRTLSLVFPNAMDGANYVDAGSSQLPRASWQLRAHGPAGTGYLLAVQTREPMDAMTVQADANSGNFRLPKSYNAALTMLREVAP